MYMILRTTEQSRRESDPNKRYIGTKRPELYTSRSEVEPLLADLICANAGNKEGTCYHLMYVSTALR